MHHFKSSLLPALAAGLLCAGTAHAQATPAAPTALACDDSLKAAFKPDAQTSVILVKQYKKGDRLPIALRDGAQTVSNDVCLVKLLVGPGNPGAVGAPSTSPGIGIEVWLPAKTAWNRRLHEVGNGGFAGSAESDSEKISVGGKGADWRGAATIAADEGAVSATTDTGHYSGGGAFAMNPDGSINTTLWHDFSVRAIHEEVVKAKALAIAYYGAAPAYTYWDGGSTGGRQGLKQAQVYPADFDGIIAGYPAINWTRFITAELYPQVAMQRDLHGVQLTAEQLELVSKAAIAACDVVGGKHYGLPLDPSSCRYNPERDAGVLCRDSGGHNASNACITPVQARTFNKIWYGMTADGSVADPARDNGWSPVLSGAQRWYGLPRGTSLAALAGAKPFPIASDQVALQLQNAAIAQPEFSNASGIGSDGWKELTYARLNHAFDQGLALQPQFSQINTDDPDLSAFKARGGKLLSYHGLADVVIPPQGTINYYERLIAGMGGLASVQEFYRLYLVPGMQHGPGNGTANKAANPAYPAAGQMYGLLTDWVEKGVAPGNAVMTSASATPVRKSLPLCVYPTKPLYRGSGDIFQAGSYRCG